SVYYEIARCNVVVAAKMGQLAFPGLGETQAVAMDTGRGEPHIGDCRECSRCELTHRVPLLGQAHWPDTQASTLMVHHDGPVRFVQNQTPRCGVFFARSAVRCR